MINILTLSTIMGVTCTSWLTIWVMLEINVLAMCNILSSSSKTIKKSESSTFMYYLIQILLSIIIVSWVFYSNKESSVMNMMVCMAILSKVGMWPFHGWYVKLITTMEMKQKAMIVIMTWQKILPIMLTTALQMSETLIFAVLMIMGGTILTSMSQLNYKMEMKKIMAISSMNNNSWILLSALVSMQCFFTFLSLYSTTLMLTLKMMEKMMEKSKHMVKNFWMNTMLVSNISGLPPLALFWGKVTVVKMMMKSEMPTEMALVMMLSACLLMYHYLWMTLSETTHSPEKSQMKLKTKKESKAMIMVTLTSVGSALVFMTSGLTK